VIDSVQNNGEQILLVDT